MPTSSAFPSKPLRSREDEMAEAPDCDVFLGEETDNVSLQIRDFGCHLEWKEMLKIDGLKLQKARDVLKGETWDYLDRPTYFTAVRNLQGFVAYRLDNEEEAEEYFEEVLRKDAVNINALGNMVFLLKGQHRRSECVNYEATLRKIFAQSRDFTGYCHSYPQRARAYADRAHAIRYFEQDKRCFRYMTYVERAATIGRYCHTTPERAEWFFDHALALYRRDVQMLYLRKVAGPDVSDVLQRKIRSGFEKAVRLFHEVIQLSNSRAYLSLSWVFIGILLNNDARNRSLCRIFANDPELAGMSADDCYKRGLSVHDSHEITTRRVGAEYVKLKRYREAKDLLDRSVSILKSWFAHRYRGVLFLSMFEDQSLTDENLKDQFEISERRKLLHLAKRELEEAQKERTVHADFSDLGQVYFWLGQHKKAKAKFRAACKSEQDDYFDVLETYGRWIRCIGVDSPNEVTDVQRQAEEHRRNLMETPLDTNGDSFSDDFDHYSRSALPDHVRLLTEADFWVASATGWTRHNPKPHRGPIPPGQYKYDFFLSFSGRDRIWCLALLNMLETDKGLRGCIEQRDFLVGDDRSETIIRCLEESHRCVVVLSPHYVQDGDSKSILRRAFRLAFRRADGDGRYVLPLLLTDCEINSIHPRLEELKMITCNMGQIHVHHWENLVSTLKQETQT